MKKILALALTMALTLCAAACAETGFSEFLTEDTDGNPVTTEIFADYDLTVVNIWATWCGYCVDEMPELARLKEMLPENVNLITICTDADAEPELAQEILSEAGANFQTLLPCDEMNEQLLGEIYAFPTTCILDSDGIVVSDAIVGVPASDDPADVYYALVQEALDALEG